MQDNQTTADIATRVGAIEHELELLELAVKTPTPWYKSVSTFVSGIALLFSFGTTFVSYQRTQAQDVHALRTELRGILQRLAVLPKDNFELTQKYAADPGAGAFLSGYLNQENALLARQAAEISRRLPKEQVSATELLAIGLALQNSYNFDDARLLLAQAVEISKELNDEVGALRGHANMMFITGKPGDGRIIYQRALNLFSKYPNYDDFVKASTHIWTELSWAGSEANSGAFNLADQRITSAEQQAAKLGPGPGKDQLVAQITQARGQLVSGAQIATTPPVLK